MGLGSGTRGYRRLAWGLLLHMPTMELGWFALALFLMLVGLAGVVVPFLPGVPLVLAGALVYATATGLEGGIGWGHLILYAVAGGAAMLFDLLAQVVGARVAGGSRAGVLGAVVGIVVGLMLGGPVGLLLGPFVGAFLFELAARREVRYAFRSGAGAAIGFLASAVVELAISLGIIASFVFSVLVGG